MTEPIATATRSFRSRLGISLAIGLVDGALTLIDPAKLRPGVRTGLCLGTGAASGIAVWVGTAPTSGFGIGAKSRGALALGMAAAGTAAMRLGFVADSAIHGTLLRRGAAHPRAIMAAGSGIVTTLMFLFDRTVNESGPDWSAGAADEEPLEVELSEPVREIVAGMLAATPGFGSAVLREQLAGARERHWGDQQEPCFRFQPDFAVDEAAPLTVPRDYTFPVHASFSAGDGTPLRLSLQVRDGRMASLMLEADPAAEVAAEARGVVSDDDPFASMLRWPEPTEVRYVPEA